MVGLFSRLSRVRNGHRRTQSAIDVRETSASTTEVTGPAVPATISHGIEVASEFKPVEHPSEPMDYDQPVKCPLPEPSILNDGRIWKERMSANARVRADLPVVKEGSHVEPGTSGTRFRSVSTHHQILPSHSAPEHGIISLLE